MSLPIVYYNKLNLLIEQGDIDGLKTLTVKYPDLVNSATVDGRAPLHMAVMKNDVDIIQLLIEKSAIIGAKTK